MRKTAHLKSIVETMSTEVQMIRDFARETDQSLASKRITPHEAGLTEADAEELHRIGLLLQQSAPTARGNKNSEVQFTTSGRVGEYVFKLVGPIKHRSFLAEMTLSYLVSHFEAFIKGYVQAVLASHPSMLKSGSTLTYEEAISHRSIAQLRSSLAEREVETLGYGSIDDMSAYFLEKFSVDLASFEQWQRLRECVYRRNLIVHNQSRVNSIYRRKLNYKGDAARLHTDMPYVIGIADTLLAFMQHVHSKLGSKIRRRPNPSVKGTSCGKPQAAPYVER